MRSKAEQKRQILSLYEAEILLSYEPVLSRSNAAVLRVFMDEQKVNSMKSRISNDGDRGLWSDASARHTLF